ncbi:Maltose/maltodextrin import ATP-binding protein MalK [compost metagenome]
MTLADTIVVLRDGIIEQVGRPLDLYDNPANQFVAGFIGSPKMNFLPATIVDKATGKVTVELTHHDKARLTLPSTSGVVGDPVAVGVRAEHFGLAGAGNVDITLDVDVAEHLGSTSYVYANAGGEALVIEREESRHENANERITVSISADKAYLFDNTGRRLR